MSGNGTEVAIEAQPTLSPLDVISNESPFNLPYAPPCQAGEQRPQ
jgi:hypothetical protein